MHVILFSFEASMGKIEDNTIKPAVLQVGVKPHFFFASTPCKTVAPNLFSSVIFDSALLYLPLKASANEDSRRKCRKSI